MTVLMSKEYAPVFGTKQMSKVDKYGWVVKDEPGQLIWVDKSQLRIDHSYQRSDVSTALVSTISAAWSWISCGCLIVAMRCDGTYWVMDGQHRKLAADNRADIQKLPCMVFNVPGKSSEASSFCDINLNRRNVTSYSKFQAMCESGDEVALSVKRMVEASGYTIVGGGSCASDVKFKVCCVAALVRSMQRDASVCRQIWNLSVDIYGGVPVKDRVFLGLCELERVLNKRDGLSLTAGPLRKRLLEAGDVALMEAARAATAYKKKGGERVYAQGILDVLNYRKQNKLEPVC